MGAHLAGSGRREGAGAQIARGETGFCFCVCDCVVDRGIWIAWSIGDLAIFELGGEIGQVPSLLDVTKLTINNTAGRAKLQDTTFR